MGLLRRLFGGRAPDEPVERLGDATPPVEAAKADASEAAYEREVLREEQDRLSELVRRQMRYADYAWTPPAQGGAKRADDKDRNAADIDSPDDEPASGGS